VRRNVRSNYSQLTFQFQSLKGCCLRPCFAAVIQINFQHIIFYVLHVSLFVKSKALYERKCKLCSVFVGFRRPVKSASFFACL